jgi:Fe-S-cluster containining protein
MPERSFYAEGLRFSCGRCSSCCRYEQGYVFLSWKDLDSLAAALNMERQECMTAWCRWVSFGDGPEYLSLKEKLNYDCVFWDKGCTVYQQRPLQCRTFPFWDSILVSAAAWENAGRECPGIGRGKLHSMAYIEACRQARLSQPVITRKPEESGL